MVEGCLRSPDVERHHLVGVLFEPVVDIERRDLVPVA